MSKGRKISMMEQIKQHTSIRKYQDKPIPQQVMDNIFTASEPHPPNQDLEGASIDLNTPYKQ